VWDKGSFYDRLTEVHGFGIEADADEIGFAVAGATGAVIAVHAAASALKSAKNNQIENTGE
jgi:hydrogenase small subunit